MRGTLSPGRAGVDLLAIPTAASLDNESDQLVQKVIREEFSGCTNLTVAHRLGESQ